MHFRKWLVKPLFEFLARRENLRQQEVEQRPELSQIVLKRRPCEEYSMRRLVGLAKSHCKFALGVFHSVAFVHYDVLPVDLAEGAFVVEDELVRGQHHVVLVVFEDGRQERPLLLLALVGNHLNGGGPLLEFVLPVVDSDQRHHHQERSLVALALNEVGKQRNCLDGFAQAHLVSENPIQIVVVEGQHPVEPKHLVRLQQASHQ